LRTWIKLASVTALALTARGANAAPPPGLSPSHFRASVIYVADLEAERAWYTDKLGMTLVRTIFHGDKPHEYAMAVGDSPGGTLLFLAENTTDRPTGPNRYSRVLLDCPDAEALVKWLKTLGVASRETHPHANYHVADPEGNDIELYTAPKP
jgi:catechol 2,3-dioxygenase-like lactoylglutathione lyase family enzyme